MTSSGSYYLVIALVVAVVGFASTSVISRQNELIAQGFKLVGTADGKMYFYVNQYVGGDERIAFFSGSLPQTWKEGGAMCQSAGMELAVVETEAQVDLVIYKGWMAGLYGKYWTSGRDALSSPGSLDQFRWNGTDIKPNPENISSFSVLGGPHTCISIYVSFESGYWYGEDCNNEYTFVLCEVLVG